MESAASPTLIDQGEGGGLKLDAGKFWLGGMIFLHIVQCTVSMDLWLHCTSRRHP